MKEKGGRIKDKGQFTSEFTEEIFSYLFLSAFICGGV
jgi:hypothetical protein